MSLNLVIHDVTMVQQITPNPHRKLRCLALALAASLIFGGCKVSNGRPVSVGGVVNGYNIKHTGVRVFYDTIGAIISPFPDSVFVNQDAKSFRPDAGFVDNGDSTTTDVTTGLMWMRTLSPKMTLEEARVHLRGMRTGSYDDWRIPTIKELFSLIDYSGQVRGDVSIRVFIDTAYFEQPIGHPSYGEREIDAQTWSSTECLSPTMGRDRSRYGVNFVDGRIKAYPITDPLSGRPNKLYFRFVRGNPHYGLNRFVDNHDGTITDEATGLVWQQDDSKTGVDWKSALLYAASLRLANHSDWRLPTIKELQSLVEYTNNVNESGRASISEMFYTSQRRDPDGSINYPYYWSSTTLLDGPHPGNQAAYVCFGKASAFFNGRYVDAHGTGAVRGDWKYAQNAKYPVPFGPQGDLMYAKNFVRCVRNAR